MTPDDETDLSEITILPDGRVYVFGMSRQVLEVLDTFQTPDPRVRQLLRHLRDLDGETEAGHAAGGETD